MAGTGDFRCVLILLYFCLPVLGNGFPGPDGERAEKGVKFRVSEQKGNIVSTHIGVFDIVKSKNFPCAAQLLEKLAFLVFRHILKCGGTGSERCGSVFLSCHSIGEFTADGRTHSGTFRVILRVFEYCSLHRFRPSYVYNRAELSARRVRDKMLAVQGLELFENSLHVD